MYVNSGMAKSPTKQRLIKFGHSCCELRVYDRSWKAIQASCCCDSALLCHARGPMEEA